MASAQRAMVHVCETVQQVVHNLRQGKSFSIGTAGQAVETLVSSMLRNADAMMLLQQLRKRDEYAYSHSIGSSVMAVAFACHMGFSRRQIKFFTMGALLLDIDKLRVPAELLLRPGRLTTV